MGIWVFLGFPPSCWPVQAELAEDAQHVLEWRRGAWYTHPTGMWEIWPSISFCVGHHGIGEQPFCATSKNKGRGLVGHMRKLEISLKTAMGGSQEESMSRTWQQQTLPSFPSCAYSLFTLHLSSKAHACLEHPASVWPEPPDL